MIEIVDAHIHLWSGGTPRAAHRQVPYSKEEALDDMVRAGVDAAVIQPPAWDPDANRIAVEAARAHPRREGFGGASEQRRVRHGQRRSGGGKREAGRVVQPNDDSARIR